VTRDDIRGAVVKALTSVAPEVQPASLGADQPFRQELELDSMDFLNFVIALCANLEIDVPEVDYPKLATLHAAEDYLAHRLGIR
jgi:acyl carrier protein